MVCQLLADWPKDFVEEVCDLVARHHTYTGVDRLTLRILIEADFLVNAYEEGLSEEAVQVGREKLFTTATGCKCFMQYKIIKNARCISHLAFLCVV